MDLSYTGFLSVMDSTGDTTIKWHKDNPTEVAAAQEHFNALINKGFTAYRALDGGKKGERIREFDPKAGEIIMVPKIVGG